MQKPSVNHKIYTVIGLMSGTSLDGIDAALIRTDGQDFVENIGFEMLSYSTDLRNRLRGLLGVRDKNDPRVKPVEQDMTLAHAAVIQKLLAKTGYKPEQIDMIGFHGQTLFHDPANRFTWQMGDGKLLARATGIAVVNDFRSNDVKEGGQGAPFLPLYHQALTSQLPKPVAILNIGGVSNITYLGANDEVIAFDTGPGNALLNDWVKRYTGQEFDDDGKIARGGTVNKLVLNKFLSNSYFIQKPPKSLDRDAWQLRVLDGMSVEDGAATLSAFTVKAIAKSLGHLPQAPLAWYVTGGGRHNSTLMNGLKQELQVPVESVDVLGWNGDGIEAEGFAWLAVRSFLKLPLSLPTTTGVPKPLTGGQYWARPA